MRSSHSPATRLMRRHSDLSQQIQPRSAPLCMALCIYIYIYTVAARQACSIFVILCCSLAADEESEILWHLGVCCLTGLERIMNRQLQPIRCKGKTPAPRLRRTRCAQAYAEENGLLFWETSAKTNVNVAEVFNDIAERLPCAAAAAPQRATDSITLTEPAPQQRKRSWCCWTS